MSQFTEYVCGFMIHADGQHVALVLKARPEWQRNRLNGVGGRIEPGETPIHAMVREFFEEAGIRTFGRDWQHRVTLDFAKGRIFFFVNRGAQVQRFAYRAPEQEPVDWYPIEELPRLRVIPNLRWLVPLCLDDDLAFPVEIRDVCDSETNGATVREKRKAGEL